jgi:hypothetical protein
MLNGLICNVVGQQHFARSVGVYRIAHYLREKNLDIEVIDYANFWTLDELKEMFRSRYNNNLSFVGFSHLFSLWDHVLEQFCVWIKCNYPHIKIISGSASNPMFDSDCIDYYVQGYGEYAIESLLKYIISNGPAPKFTLGISSKKKILDAIHFYPAFPMHSLMIKYQDRDFLEPHEWLGVEFARGCKFKCDFCNFPVLGVKGDYSRDADDFKEQMLNAYDRFGITNYYVSDETFNDRTEKITKFADVVEQLPFRPWFSGYIRADLLIMRPNDRNELLRMNFLGQYYGIESFNYESNKLIGKGIRQDRLLQGLVDIKSFFKNSGTTQYRGTVSLIAGLPHETIDSLNFTKQWLIDHWQDQSFMFFSLTIPDNNNNTVKPSLFSLDYKKYGYSPMTDYLTSVNIPQSLAKAINDPVHNGTIVWENPNMNIFDAEQFVLGMVAVKQKHNFKTNCFNLSDRLKTSLTLQDRLNLSLSEMSHLRWKDSQSYIHKKLSL